MPKVCVAASMARSNALQSAPLAPCIALARGVAARGHAGLPTAARPTAPAPASRALRVSLGPPEGAVRRVSSIANALLCPAVEADSYRAIVHYKRLDHTTSLGPARQ